MKGTPALYLKDFSLSHTNDLIFWSDLEGRIVYVNQVAADVLGYQVAQLQDKYVWEILNGGGKKGWAAQKELLLAKQYFSVSISYLRKDGSIYPSDTQLYYIQKGAGYICAIARYRASIGESERIENFTHQTLNQIRDIIIWSKPDGEIVYFNDAVITQLGYSREEFEHIKHSELIKNYDTTGQNRFRKSMKTEKGFVGECILCKKNGGTIIAEINATTVFYAGASLNCTTFRDISLRRAAEDRLLKQQLESKNIIHTATDAIITADKAGNVLLWNGAAERIFGWTHQEIYQQPLEKIMPKQFRQAHHHGMNRYMQTNQPSAIGKTVELEGQRKDGSIFPMAISLASWKDGTEYYFCGIIRDISERKAKEQELQRILAENIKLKSGLEVENTYLQATLEKVLGFEEIITVDKKYQQVLLKLEEVAPTDTTVLINGETGTGKELVARAIHRKSKRNKKPLITINCATLSENLIESELFGHEVGAFTGAVKQKKGLFEVADGGTLFLDEIGELSMNLQAKLLRVLQEGEFSRLGSTTIIKVNVRIIAATNRKLPKRIKQNKFREDLYYRLNVFPLVNPPLRNRPNDIPVLINHFIKKYNRRMGKQVSKWSKSTMEKLSNHHYPGNIRELENIIERAMIVSKGKTLKMNDWQPMLAGAAKDDELLPLEELIKEHIIKALKTAKGQIMGAEGAAALLGMKDRTLQSKMRKLNIHRKDYL